MHVGLVNNYGEEGVWLQNGGMAGTFSPLQKKKGGGAGKVCAILKGDTTRFRTCYFPISYSHPSFKGKLAHNFFISYLLLVSCILDMVRTFIEGKKSKL